MSSATENKNEAAPEAQTGLAPEVKTTCIFAGIAAVCLLITGAVELASRPAKIEEFGKLGQEFYPDFKDPTKASSLDVSTVTDQLQMAKFSVKQADNGRWVIPSHHNYPADAADQLAQTASSVIGIKRGAMVTRWPNDHASYGVVDPDQDSLNVDEVEGVGKRLTLTGKGDEVLASFIIGKQVKGEPGKYYVRHPGEDETYITDLKIQLSTKFTDWVKTDLLDINAADIRQININDYSFDEIQGTLTSSVFSNLSRESSTADWALEGLEDKTKEVNKDSIKETLDTLGSLKIAGVRPKQAGLTPELKIDRSKIRSGNQLQNDLLQRGFLLQPSQTNEQVLELLAREGEMSIGTEDGIVYKMYFGRAFTGSDEDLEVGLDIGEEAKPEPKKEEGKDDEEKKDGEDASGGEDADAEDKEETDPNKKPGRYLFIRVLVDESLIDNGEAPVKPEKSAELLAAEKAVEELGDEADTSAEDAGKDEATDGASDEASEDKKEEGEDKKELSPKEKLKELKLAYDMSIDEYEIAMKDYEDNSAKVDEANKKAKELNRRFEQWYYVIPGDSYDKLALDRDDLLKDVELIVPDDVPAPGTPPGLSPSIPSGLNVPTPPAPEEPNDDPAKKEASAEQPEKEMKAEDKPAEDKPAEEKPAEEKPAEEKPAEEKPAEEKPAEEKPAEEKPAEEKPAEDKPAEEKPAEEKPAEEKPAEEKPAEEKPAEEKPAEEKPAEEKPAEDKPAEDKPAEDKPADS